MAQEVRAFDPVFAREAPYFTTHAPPTEFKPSKKKDPHDKLLRIINILLRIASIKGYDRFNRIIDSDGNVVENSNILHLLLNALTPGRVLVGQSEFIKLLYRSQVDPDLIINDNVRLQLISMRPSGAPYLSPPHTPLPPPSPPPNPPPDIPPPPSIPPPPPPTIQSPSPPQLPQQSPIPQVQPTQQEPLAVTMETPPLFTVGKRVTKRRMRKTYPKSSFAKPGKRSNEPFEWEVPEVKKTKGEEEAINTSLPDDDNEWEDVQDG